MFQLLDKSEEECKEIERSPLNSNNAGERLLLNNKTPWFLASGGDEFNPGPETRLDRSEILYNKSYVIKFY